VGKGRGKEKCPSVPTFDELRSSRFTKGGGKMKREEEMEWTSARAVRMMGIKLIADG
jgi:hypothetical protein